MYKLRNVCSIISFPLSSSTVQSWFLFICSRFSHAYDTYYKPVWKEKKSLSLLSLGEQLNYTKTLKFVYNF